MRALMFSALVGLGACAATPAPSPDAAPAVPTCASAVPAYYATGCTIEGASESTMASVCAHEMDLVSQGTVCAVYVVPWLRCMADVANGSSSCAACDAAWVALTDGGC